jgi:hypothetical protein
LARADTNNIASQVEILNFEKDLIVTAKNSVPDIFCQCEEKNQFLNLKKIELAGGKEITIFLRDSQSGVLKKETIVNHETESGNFVTISLTKSETEPDVDNSLTNKIIIFPGLSCGSISIPPEVTEINS